MKKFYLALAAVGVLGWAAYAYRDRLLAGMLGAMSRLQTLGEETPEGEDEDIAGDSIHFPRKEEDLDAR